MKMKVKDGNVIWEEGTESGLEEGEFEGWDETWAMAKDRRALTGPRVMTIRKPACACSKDLREGIFVGK